MVSGLGESTTSGAVLGRSPEMDSGRNAGLFYCHVSTEESDWSRLHSFHAENSYKTMLARVCGVSLPVSQAASSQCVSSLTSFRTVNIWMSEYFHQKYIPYPEFPLNRLDPPVCPVAGAPQRV